MENRKLTIGSYGIEWAIKDPNHGDEAQGLGIIAPITSVMGGK
ncbi:hypothetical protein [Campylobacter fetus]